MLVPTSSISFSDCLTSDLFLPHSHNGNGNVIRNILPTRNSSLLLNEWEVCPTLYSSINQLNIRIISIRMSHWGVRTIVGYFSWCQGMVCRARKISSIFFRSVLYISSVIGQFLLSVSEGALVCDILLQTTLCCATSFRRAYYEVTELTSA